MSAEKKKNPLDILFVSFGSWIGEQGCTGDEVRKRAESLYNGAWHYIRKAETFYLENKPMECKANLKQAMRYWKTAVNKIKGGK